MHKYAARVYARSARPGSAFAPGSGRRIEIGAFFRHPAQKPDNFGMVNQLVPITRAARQFGIGKHGFNRAAANRMHRHRRPPALAFGHRMILIDLFAKRTQAQPAGRRICE